MNKRRLIGKRNEIGLTQKQMADKLGMSEATYRLKEQDKREFTEKEIQVISEVLNTPVSYFFAK